MDLASFPSASDVTLLSWSSGKDSAWTLHQLRERGLAVRGLVTSCSSRVERVAMHGVRNALLAAQADSLGLPLHRVELPVPCSNEVYEDRMGRRLRELRGAGATGIAFGDLLLADVRAYRERQAAAVGLQPWFPLFGADTATLAREMIRGGLRAVLTCVDPKACPPEFAGADFDLELLERLPAGVDPCGENGEFHTFTYDGPGFGWRVGFERGAIVERDGFVFADLIATETT